MTKDLYITEQTEFVISHAVQKRIESSRKVNKNKQGRRSGGTTYLPKMWSGIAALTWCHMWVVITCNCSCWFLLLMTLLQGFFSGFSGLSCPLHKNIPNSWIQSLGNTESQWISGWRDPLCGYAMAESPIYFFTSFLKVGCFMKYGLQNQQIIVK